MSFNIPKEANLLLGTRNVKNLINKPLDYKVISFFETLSKEIFKDKITKKYEDLALFGFFIRSANTKKNIKDTDCNLLGRGLAFHVNTSNVPLNFAYSLYYGLIFGNTNILKISRTMFPQTTILINILKKVLKIRSYNFLKRFIFIIQYDNQVEISTLISINSDTRIIWGSDQTIEKFKRIQSTPRVVDLYFPDRISLSIINSEKYMLLKNKNDLLKKFYKDSLYFDQLGCSSPQSILWIGRKSKLASKDFWNKFSSKFYSEYPFDFRKGYDKHNHLFKLSLLIKDKTSFKNYKERFLVFGAKNNFNVIKNLKGINGIFFQTYISNINLIDKFISKKTQTLSCFGFDKKQILNIIQLNSIKGIDRVVDIGSALNMNTNGDGYDLKAFLTRKIEEN